MITPLHHISHHLFVAAVEAERRDISAPALSRRPATTAQPKTVAVEVLAPEPAARSSRSRRTKLLQPAVGI